MRIARLPLSAAALAFVLGFGGVGGSGAARAETALPDGAAMQTIIRILTQYTLLAARTMVDLTYDHLAVDPHSGDVVVTGLKLYPVLDWDQDGTCVVEIDRIAGSANIGFEVIASRREITGVTVAPSCFMPEQAAMMAAFGYDRLTVDNMSIDLGFARRRGPGDPDLDQWRAGRSGGGALRARAIVETASSSSFRHCRRGGLSSRNPASS
jgi:hypothetical protein